ncbi:hypothetical protein ACSS6W_008741 [Trichoderma asperelloides]
MMDPTSRPNKFAARPTAPSTTTSTFTTSKPFLPTTEVLKPEGSKAVGDGIPGFTSSFNTSGKSGGAIRPIGENFSVNPANGTLSFSLPINTSPSRGGFGPNLALSYDSGSGNGPFGFGWSVHLPAIQRKTSDGIPTYRTGEDEFVFGGSELVPWIDEKDVVVVKKIGHHHVMRYRPRFESHTARIEKWTRDNDSTDVHWRTISGGVTSIFGLDDMCRIVDSSQSSKNIFSWLLCRSFDTSGNAMEYVYKPEDGAGLEDIPLWEANRSTNAKLRQRYIKRIKYGNRKPNRDMETWEPTEWPSKDNDWMFDVVFDYGEHQLAHNGKAASFAENQIWDVRKDCFSVSNSGFEVRTYRLCRRVLMFHRFHELRPEPGKPSEVLITSTTFSYRENAFGSFLTETFVSGHELSGMTYKTQSVPPWTFTYSQCPDPQTLKRFSASAINLVDLPSIGLWQSEWIDLDGEGLPGLLLRLQDGTLSYQRNFGGSLSFDSSVSSTNGSEPATSECSFLLDPQVLSQQPTPGVVKGCNFLDLDRNGRLNLVCKDSKGVPCGFYERIAEEDAWSKYCEFPETPNCNIQQQQQSDFVVSIDLTGNGSADLLFSINDSQDLMWQKSLGKVGFAALKCTSMNLETSSYSPRLTNSNETKTYVADMTGDGLSDIVEISANRIAYWANIGHGRFTSMVEMGNPPNLASQENFEQERIKLVDVDGTGTTDLLYILPGGGAHLYYNFSGNQWSDRILIRGIPQLSSPLNAFVLDLFGQGTGLLCWADTTMSSTGTADTIHYLDLMGGQKPHLLTGYANSLGSTTSVVYAPSTNYFLKDCREGKPWTTRLPHPVQCIASVDHHDQITGNSSTVRYMYHNGYYDYFDKQFSGFEMVEEWYSERIIIGPKEVYEPPEVHKKSWFCVGQSLAIDTQHFFPHYAAPRVASSISTMGTHENELEGLRALKGTLMRSEMYGLDGSPRQTVPYAIDEQAYEVSQIQKKGANKYAVFQMSPRESVSTQLEQSLDDPRVTHEIVLEINDYGSVEKALRVVYPRRTEAVSLSSDTNPVFSDVVDNQTKGNVSFSRCWYTNAVDWFINPTDPQGYYRTPLPWRQQDCEIVHMPLPQPHVSILEIDQVRLINFDEFPSVDTLEKPYKQAKALRSETKTFFRNSDLSQRLSAGKIEAMSLLDQTYQLAFTPEILKKIQTGQSTCGIVRSSKELATALSIGGYADLDDDGCWWAVSGRALFQQPSQSDVPSRSELMLARSSFYTPTVMEDAFKNVSSIALDTYWLMAESSTDAMGNIMHFKNDYRVLQPIKITDANQVSRQLVYDELSNSITTALNGPRGNELDCDSLDGFVTSVSDSEIAAVLSDPSGDATRRLLGNSSSRTLVCLDQFSKSQLQKINDSDQETKITPSFSISISRDLSYRRSSSPKLMVVVSHLDGGGNVVQTATLAHPNDPKKKWLISGISVHDSSGNVIRALESIFSTSPAYSSVATPNSSTLAPVNTNFFDACGRSVGTLFAEHTWTKTVIGPWTSLEYSTNDTLLCQVPQEDPNLGVYFLRLSSTSYLPIWADLQQRSVLRGSSSSALAIKKSLAYTKVSAPSITHYGACGLPVRHVQVAGDKTYTRSYVYDYSGNRIRDFDSSNRLVEKRVHDFMNRPLQSSGMDTGEKWAIPDASGASFFSWNSKGIYFELKYDCLRRGKEKRMTDYRQIPTKSMVVIKTVYGDDCGGLGPTYSKGRIWKVLDQSGINTNMEFDMRGRCVRSHYEPATEYKVILDWQTEHAVQLETDAQFVHTSSFNNLDQCLEESDSQGNRTRRVYNLLGQVERVDYCHHSSVREPKWVPYLKESSFRADGLPERNRYGNNVEVMYKYDAMSKHLISKKTTRPTASGSIETFQDFSYTYDCRSRQVHVKDSSQQAKFFYNCRVDPEWEYTYDTVGQLIEATGRGQLTTEPGQAVQLQPYSANTGNKPLSKITNGDRLYKYLETYKYDLDGNMRSMTHSAPEATKVTGWTRKFLYNEKSLLSPSDQNVANNQLSRTFIGEKPDSGERYAYDQTGCMTHLPQYSHLRWDMNDMLAASSTQKVDDTKGIPEITYYVYDSFGNRVRKVTESGASIGSTPRKTKETFYLSGVELQRKFNKIKKTRYICKVSSGSDTLALVETTSDNGGRGGTQGENSPLIRFQISTGSELDDKGQLITYEEYTPFGSPIYTAVYRDVKAPRTYRFARYEHDRETGLYHCGARYYASWLGRWTSPDPMGDVDGPNLYQYVLNDPVNGTDPTGTSTRTPKQFIIKSKSHLNDKHLGQWGRGDNGVRPYQQHQYHDTDPVVANLLNEARLARGSTEPRHQYGDVQAKHDNMRANAELHHRHRNWEQIVTQDVGNRGHEMINMEKFQNGRAMIRQLQTQTRDDFKHLCSNKTLDNLQKAQKVNQKAIDARDSLESNVHGPLLQFGVEIMNTLKQVKLNRDEKQVNRARGSLNKLYLANQEAKSDFDRSEYRKDFIERAQRYIIDLEKGTEERTRSDLNNMADAKHMLEIFKKQSESADNEASKVQRIEALAIETTTLFNANVNYKNELIAGSRTGAPPKRQEVYLHKTYGS